MVIDPRQDLDVDAIGEAVVGEVGLPGFVGLLGLETDVRRLRFLLRFRADQVGAPDDAVDRRSGQLDLVVVFEVPDDRVGAGIQTGSSELLAESDHDLDDFSRRGIRSCSWSSRSWSERAVTLGVVARDETADLRLRDDDDSSDDHTGFGHPPDPCL